jgi:hypothetical protein
MPFKDPEAQRAYHREYMRGYYRTHRAEHIARTTNVNRRARATTRKLIEELKSHPCLDCGGNFPPVLMDFDHVRGTKRGIISRLSGGRMAKAKLLEEVAKCEVVCANCHRRRTLLRRLGLEVKPSDVVRFLGPNYVSVLVYA